MTQHFKILCILTLMLSLSTFSFSQSDTTVIIENADSTSLDSLDSSKKLFDFKDWKPQKKAGVMSAVLPGLGQAYNKKYWKIPIIYTVGSFLVASTLYHHKEYKVVRDGLIDTAWTDTTFIPIEMQGGTLLFRDNYFIQSEQQYRTARDRQRQTRDRYIVLSAVFYTLNIVDAIVDAHLNNFDLSDDLSLEINPNIYSTNNTFAAGVSLKFSLK